MDKVTVKVILHNVKEHLKFECTSWGRTDDGVFKLMDGDVCIAQFVQCSGVYQIEALNEVEAPMDILLRQPEEVIEFLSFFGFHNLEHAKQVLLNFNYTKP